MTHSKALLCASSILFSMFILRSFSSAAQAQVAKGDIYFGYSRTGTDTFYPDVGGLNEWEGAMHVKLHKPFLGIEGDLAHYGLGANSTVPRTTIFMGGPRITVGVSGVKVFAHALLGGEHSANSGGPTPTSAGVLAGALGGGLDLRIAPIFAWRVAGDYIGNSSGSPAGAPLPVSALASFSGFEEQFPPFSFLLTRRRSAACMLIPKGLAGKRQVVGNSEL